MRARTNPLPNGLYWIDSSDGGANLAAWVRANPGRVALVDQRPTGAAMRTWFRVSARPGAFPFGMGFPSVVGASAALEVLEQAVATAEALLAHVAAGAHVAGVGPDVITRASAAMHAAKTASDSVDEAVSAPGKKAARVLADGVLKAYEMDRAVFVAAGQGAQDLVTDAWSVVSGPLVIAFLLWQAFK